MPSTLHRLTGGRFAKVCDLAPPSAGTCQVCTEAQAALLRAAGGGGPPIDPRQTLDGGLGLPAEDDE